MPLQGTLVFGLLSGFGFRSEDAVFQQVGEGSWGSRFRVSGLGLGLGKSDVRLCGAELGDYYGRICLPCFFAASELSALCGLIYNPKPQGFGSSASSGE